MEARIARIESDIEYIKRDISEIKGDLKDIRTETRGDFRSLVLLILVSIIFPVVAKHMGWL